MCIIAIVMTGYGVSSRSMVYYANPDIFTDIDTSFNGRSIFRQIAYPVYYLMYGETGDELADLDSKVAVFFHEKDNIYTANFFFFCGYRSSRCRLVDFNTGVTCCSHAFREYFINQSSNCNVQV